MRHPVVDELVSRLPSNGTSGALAPAQPVVLSARSVRPGGTGTVDRLHFGAANGERPCRMPLMWWPASRNVGHIEAARAIL